MRRFSSFHQIFHQWHFHARRLSSFQVILTLFVRTATWQIMIRKYFPSLFLNNIHSIIHHSTHLHDRCYRYYQFSITLSNLHILFVSSTLSESNHKGQSPSNFRSKPVSIDRPFGLLYRNFIVLTNCYPPESKNLNFPNFHLIN